MEGLSAEEVWAVLPGEGYRNQYEGDFQILHPEKKLIGRAFTVQFMPRAARHCRGPNEADAKAKGLRDNGNQRALDMLQEGDVLVADIFGQDRRRHDGGGQSGDLYPCDDANGFVVDGAIRDLDGIFPIDMSVYYRGVHPTPISAGTDDYRHQRADSYRRSDGDAGRCGVRGSGRRLFRAAASGEEDSGQRG